MSSNFGNDKDYNPGRDASFVAETGAVSNNREATNVDFRREDREAAESESSGRIPQSELKDLQSAGDEVFEKRTRGVHNDAYKQERELDEALEQEDTL